MIIDIFGIERIYFDDEKDNIFVIEDTNIFSQIVNSVYEYYNGEKNDLLILSDDKIITKNQLLLVTDIINFDFQSKTIINKLNNNVYNQIIFNSDLEQQIIEKINNINNLINDVLYDYNLDIEIKKEKQIENYIKYLGLKIESRYDNLLNKILNIIEIVSELFPNYYVIFINQLAYFDKNQILEIFKYKNYKKCNILFIEKYFNQINSINRIIIDKDFYVYQC